MTVAEMRVRANDSAKAAEAPCGGDPSLATLKGAGIIASVLWRIGAEICARLEGAKE